MTESHLGEIERIIAILRQWGANHKQPVDIDPKDHPEVSRTAQELPRSRRAPSEVEFYNWLDDLRPIMNKLLSQ